ncbi:hypothetical protein MPH_05726 [Macrophomina phaseolina MS6]|uniref:Uncharacterized protein n=1 Tax=Macrophomina phaseolina (strain MS6) TaxID=1126212 RepID=K2RWH3_MACPH|nr:hypothetical protein MPH_05726 [Macrophomina phaseolina MS6]
MSLELVFETTGVLTVLSTLMYQFWVAVMLAAAAVQLFRCFLRDPVHRILRSFRKAFSFSIFQPLLERIGRWTPESLTYERVPSAVVAEKDSRSCFNFKLFPIGETMAIWMYWILSIALNFTNYQFYNESNIRHDSSTRCIYAGVVERKILRVIHR